MGGHPVIPLDQLPPLADVLLIVADEDPGVMLFRYTTHPPIATQLPPGPPSAGAIRYTRPVVVAGFGPSTSRTVT